MRMKFSSLCNICRSNEELKNINEDLKSQLVSLLGNKDLFDKFDIYLCLSCRKELRRIDRFKEKCFVNLINFIHDEIITKLKLENVKVKKNHLQDFENAEVFGQSSTFALSESEASQGETIKSGNNDERGIINEEVLNSEIENSNISNISVTKLSAQLAQIALHANNTVFEEVAVSKEGDSFTLDQTIKKDAVDENKTANSKFLQTSKNVESDDFEIQDVNVPVTDVEDVYPVESNTTRKSEKKAGLNVPSRISPAEQLNKNNKNSGKGRHNDRSSIQLQKKRKLNISSPTSAEPHIKKSRKRDKYASDENPSYEETFESQDAFIEENRTSPKSFKYLSGNRANQKSDQAKHISSNPFKRVMCEKEFHRLNNLKIPKHCRSDFQPKCNKKSPTSNFKIHESSTLKSREYVHNSVRRYKFPESRLWKFHEPVHSDARKYKCEDCFKTFETNIQLMWHKSIYDRDMPRKCIACELKFNTLHEFAKHKRIHKKVSRSNNLKNRQDERIEVKPFMCSICFEKFKSYSDLIKHEVIQEKKLICKICNNTFDSDELLKIHEPIHIGRTYKCKICEEEFLTSNSRKIHERVHSNVMP